MRATKRAMMLAWAGLCSLALVLTCVGSAKADPIHIREAWVAPGNWASIWLQKKDLAKHLGQSYVMDPVHFVGTPPMITAMANNEVEVANLAYSTLGIAVENAGLGRHARRSATNSRTASPVIIRRNTWCSRTARLKRSRTSRAKSSPLMPRAAPSTSP